MPNNFNIVTFGELLLRHNINKEDSKNNGDLDNQTFLGGSELNTSVLLSSFKNNVRYVSAIPNDFIGEKIERKLNNLNVNTNYIQKINGRVGAYFSEYDGSSNLVNAAYDRSNSVFAKISSDIDFDSLFNEVSLFHLSTISLVLGNKSLKLAKLLISEATKRNILISVDTNFRKKLISYSKFKKIIAPFIKKADILFGWISEGDFFPLKYNASNDDILESIKYTLNKFGNKKIISTLKEFNDNKIKIKGFMYENGNIIITKEIKAGLISQIGGGDAFSAGVLQSILLKQGTEDVLMTGVKSLLTKYQQKGDISLVSLKEINDFK